MKCIVVRRAAQSTAIELQFGDSRIAEFFGIHSFYMRMYGPYEKGTFFCALSLALITFTFIAIRMKMEGDD